jgi:hypothetical protein
MAGNNRFQLCRHTPMQAHTFIILVSNFLWGSPTALAMQVEMGRFIPSVYEYRVLPMRGFWAVDHPSRSRSQSSCVLLSLSLSTSVKLCKDNPAVLVSIYLLSLLLLFHLLRAHLTISLQNASPHRVIPSPPFLNHHCCPSLPRRLSRCQAQKQR